MQVENEAVLRELARMASAIDAREDWWRFPTESRVRGFMGTGPLMVVGDQPSTSPWSITHPNRRLFYDTLARAGGANAHLTDLYKRRGKSGSLRDSAPADFADHVAFFRRELDLLRPTRVIALGAHAFELLLEHVPDVGPRLHKMWHFAYVGRYNKGAEYETHMRTAFGVSDR